MRNGMRLFQATSILVVAVAAGCASDSTVGLSRNRSSSTASSSRSGSGTGLGSIWGRDSNSVASARPSTTASPAESVSRVFRQVSNSVSDAFQPETVPASDPTRLSTGPDQLSPRVYVRAAAWAEDQKAPHIAQSQYEKALSLEPNNAQTLVSFARFQDRQGKANEARKLYQQALKASPRNAIVLNDLGIFYARRREFATSLDYLEEAVKSAPDNVRYRNNLAGVLVQIRRPEEAVAVLRNVHADAVARMNVGHFLCMEKEYSQAASYFRQASQLDPSLVAAREMLSRIEGPEVQFQRSTPTIAPVEPNRSESSPYQLGSHPNSPAPETRSSYGPETPLTSAAPSRTEPPSEGPRRLPAIY